MSLNVSHSISFAKWFLHKHRQSLQSDHFDTVISLLDQSSWDEFSRSNIDVAKSTADALIPQLVEKMPPIVRQKKTNKHTHSVKPAVSSIFRVDAATSTNDSQSTFEEPSVALEEPTQKKRGGKSKNSANIVPVENVPVVSEEPVAVVSEEPAKKKRGGGGGKSKKSANIVPVVSEEPVVVVSEEPVPVVSEELVVVVSEEPVVVSEQPVTIVAEEPAKKKRGGKSKKNDSEPDFPHSEKKTRGPKKKESAIDEVVIPLQEQLQLLNLNSTSTEVKHTIEHDHELTEESFHEEESIDLIEHFVNDVLYYVDAQGNWFDSELNTVSRLFTE
jgi:hypothetical protein